MATSLFKFKGQAVPDAFRDFDADQDLADGISGGFSVLHYRNQAFSLKHKGSFIPIPREDGSHANTVDLIIVSVSSGVSKVYFPQWKGEASAGQRPICKSAHGDVPDADAEIPQNKTCAGCTHNEWRKGGKGKECQDHKRAAVMLMPALTKKLLGSPLLETIQFKIPPGSFGTWRDYVNMLKHEAYPIQSVITRVSFDPDKQFCMLFDAVQVLTAQEAPLIRKLHEDSQTQRIIGGSGPNVIRQVKAVEVAPARIETGLIEGFAEKDTPPQEPVKSKGNGQSEPPWQENAVPGFVERNQKPQPPTETIDSTNEQDDEVARVLAKKVEDMLR